MKYIFILWAGVFCQAFVLAQKTIISGTAYGAEGKLIRLSAPGDLITFWEKPLASAKVDSSGHFSINVTLDKTSLAFISIDFHRTELFLEPSLKYDLRIDPMNYDEKTEIDPNFESQNLNCSIANSDATELNALIGTFDSIYSGFLLKHFNGLYRDRNKVLLDTFRVHINQQFGAAKNSYFISYVTYKLASLEQLTQYYNQPQIAIKYFSDKPVLYNNQEYMEFFNNYFSKYLTVTSNIFRKMDLHPVLKSRDPYTALLKVMTADTLLKNNRLRELVMLKGLMELYTTPSFSQPEILSAILMAKEKTPFPENRTVAENMISLLTKLKPGTLAPEFTLISREQKEVSLKSLRGKPVVLCFWTTYCDDCLSEMELISQLYETYKDKIHFVCVSADKSFSKMLFFVNLKKNYLWTFVHMGDHVEVLKEYEVNSYPLFVLIDKDGKINKYPAAQPSNGLEADLQKILEE